MSANRYQLVMKAEDFVNGTYYWQPQGTFFNDECAAIMECNEYQQDCTSAVFGLMDMSNEEVIYTTDEEGE